MPRRCRMSCGGRARAARSIRTSACGADCARRWSGEVAVPHLACMLAVAAFYGLPPRVLPAIQAVEGGQVGTVSRNADGSEDLGVMQVNTRWLGPVAQLTGLPEATVRERLIGDACFNIAAAGAILHSHLQQTSGDLMRAVG